MVKVVLSLIVGVLVGVACRYYDVPVPAPPKLLGAMLVLAMTLGYIATDYMLTPDEAPVQDQSDAGLMR